MAMKEKNNKIRLSQCMIVKNEEKNIRRALSWGRELMCEQIVVDTGSTDKTVEIAMEMGAKVYQFVWCDDFSAAKNYAIEQATGDWIAFLDADEYFDEKSAAKLFSKIEEAEAKTSAGRPMYVIRARLVDVKEGGKTGVLAHQDRIFRNDPHIRYVNKIHEKLCFAGTGDCSYLDARAELLIIHTGYTKAAFEETGKLERNLQMLKKKLADEPDNVETLAYMGDSYMAEGQMEKAKECFHKAVSYGKKDQNSRKAHMFRSIILLLSIYAKEFSSNQETEVRELHRQYREIYGVHPDGDTYFGVWLYQNKKYKEARKYLESALDKMKRYKGSVPLYANGDLGRIYAQLADCCRHLDREGEAARYCVLSLGADRYVTKSLLMLLGLLKKEEGEEETAAETWELLSQLYDLSKLKDQMMIIKGAKLTGFKALEKRVYDFMPEEWRRAVQEELEKRIEEMRAYEESTENTD